MRVAEIGLFTLGGCELVVQMATATSENFDVTQGENAEYPRSMDGGSEKDQRIQTNSHNAQQRSLPSQQSAPQKMISREENKDKGQYVVEAVDIPQGTHKQLLSLVFSSKKESGGGDIVALEYDQDAGWARISYKRKEGNIMR